MYASALQMVTAFLALGCASLFAVSASNPSADTVLSDPNCCERPDKPIDCAFWCCPGITFCCDFFSGTQRTFCRSYCADRFFSSCP